MANKKITALTALTSAADDDVLAIVDASETSVSSTGETKKITKANLVSGLGSVTSVDVSGGSTGLTTSGGPVTSTGTITVAGTLAEGSGGTNQTTYAKGDILFSDATNSLDKLGIGGTGEVLKTSSGGIPEWGSVSGSGTVTSVAVAGTDGIDVDSGSPITGAGTITLGLSGIANAALTNSSVSYGGVSVALGASNATPAFDLADATNYEGTAVKSTGESGGTKFLREDGDGSCSWQAVSVTSDLVTFSPSGTGATDRTVQAKLRDVVCVKDFGATGDGSTDDASAIQAAIDAVEAAGGGTVHVPAGTYKVGTRLVINTTLVAIVGEGRWQSILKASGTLTSLLHIGVTDASSSQIQAEVSNIQLHGNSTCTDAVLKLWCPTRCFVNHVHIRSGANYGLKSDTHTGSADTQAWANNYLDIKTEANGGSGFYFVGEKDSQFDNLHAYDNGGDGFFWGGTHLDPSGTSLFETTTCMIGSCLSRDNTGNGFVMDAVEKFSIGQLESTINGAYGLKFLTSNTTATSIGQNSIQCGSFISRNDSSGGLRMADSSKVISTNFGSVVVRGPTMTAGAMGIYLAGTDAISIDSIYVVNVPGTALLVDSGTPLGGSSTPCTNMQFGKVYLNSNGASGQTSHGLSVGDGSQVSIGIMTTNNSFTDTGTTNYEINAYNSADIRFSGGVDIDAAHIDHAINGNNINFGGALSLANATPYMALRDSTITNPTVLTSYAALYIDSADGDIKVKFGDDDVKSLTTLPAEIGMACSDETTALTTGTAKATFRMPHAMTLTAVRASVTTAPVGSVLTVDINEGGSTILSTKITIDASEKTSTTAATPPVISDSALADDAEITVDIDTVGSSTAGTGLKIWLIGTRA